MYSILQFGHSQKSMSYSLQGRSWRSQPVNNWYFGDVSCTLLFSSLFLFHRLTFLCFTLSVPCTRPAQLQKIRINGEKKRDRLGGNMGDGNGKKSCRHHLKGRHEEKGCPHAWLRSFNLSKHIFSELTCANNQLLRSCFFVIAVLLLLFDLDHH